MKCDNCPNEAQYTVSEPGVSEPSHYCSNCLPTWLYDRARAGHFPVAKPEVKEEDKASAKRKRVEEKPVVEEAASDAEVSADENS